MKEFNNNEALIDLILADLIKPALECNIISRQNETKIVFRDSAFSFERVDSDFVRVDILTKPAASKAFVFELHKNGTEGLNEWLFFIACALRSEHVTKTNPRSFYLQETFKAAIGAMHEI